MAVNQTDTKEVDRHFFSSSMKEHDLPDIILRQNYNHKFTK